ncbi:MAG: cytochrome c-type biogenesis protein CcmH [Alphaproteobacteria bacterium]|nr:cytochrome c-type biogenesis protein CcmH [Alphaproteobacteria bacterium]
MRARLAALMVALPLAALAVEPGEELKDPVLEARARILSRDIRCLVCQNQSIDDSNAPLARDLRLIVRERLVAGDTDDGIIQYLVARYGDFVRLQPPMKPATYALWFGPAAILAIGVAGILIFFARRRRRIEVPAPLSAEERGRLDRILADQAGEERR